MTIAIWPLIDESEFDAPPDLCCVLKRSLFRGASQSALSHLHSFRPSLPVSSRSFVPQNMPCSAWSLVLLLPVVVLTAPIDHGGVIVEGNDDPVGRLVTLSQLAFTFLDRDANQKVDREEMEYLNGRSFNGMHFSNAHKVDEVFVAMDSNGDKIISMAEFVGFDKWLFKLLDTSKTRKISIKNLKAYSEKNAAPEYAILDRNGNGFIEPEEMRPKEKHVQ